MNFKAVAVDNVFNQLSLQSNPLVKALTEKNEQVKEIPVIGSLSESVAEALNQVFAKNSGLPVSSRLEHMGEDLGDADPNQFKFKLGRRDVIDGLDNHCATLLTIQSAAQADINAIGYTDVAEDIAEEAIHTPSVVLSSPVETIPEDLGPMIESHVKEGIKVFLVLIVPDNQELEAVEFEESGLLKLAEENEGKVNLYLTYLNKD